MRKPTRSPRAAADVSGAVRAPYPGFIEPCLASPRTAVPAKGEWIHEIKHDGYRVQAHLRAGQAILYTRRGYDWTQAFAPIATALKRAPARELILDGEVVVPDARGVSDFHALQADLAKGRTDRLVYYAFDVLYHDGLDLRGVPLIERKRVLEEVLKDLPETSRIQLNRHLEAQDAAAVLKQACAMHLEGIVSKGPTSVYRSGRQESWIKVKCVKADTYPIIAFVEKLGAKPRRIASLYLGRWEGDRLLYAGKAQTGFKHEMLYTLRERLDPYIRDTSPLSVPVTKPKATWVEPVLEAEIEYSALTAAQWLRAPVFKGIREDLLPKSLALTRRPAVRVPAPGTVTGRTAARKRGRSGVATENILQLLPDAVVPTKEELKAYWTGVAPEALPYVQRRPLKLVRHAHGTSFYHKGPLPPAPAGVWELKIEKREGGTGIRWWVEDLEGLLGLLEAGVVELHAWNSTVDDLEHPNVLVLDLDPGEGVEWEFVIETAFAVREHLSTQGLESWPKLTGGKGVHVMAPLIQRITHDEAHRESRVIAQAIARTAPERYTISATAEGRGKLFIDYLRNGRGTTAVATYSPRARLSFPIAAPTTWKSLERGIEPDAFTMAQPFPQRGPRASRQHSPRSRSIASDAPSTGNASRSLGPRRRTS